MHLVEATEVHVHLFVGEGTLLARLYCKRRKVKTLSSKAVSYICHFILLGRILKIVYKREKTHVVVGKVLYLHLEEP